MKASAGILILVMLAAPAMGDSYGWEDGGTILGSFGNLTNPLNVTSPVHSGNRALQLSESPISGTPQAYVAFIENLTDGDVIDGSFWGWDDTDGTSPSLRIWGHYAQSGDINSYAGSASGNFTFTTGTPQDPWSQVGHQWTFDSNGGTRDALVIEARLYSSSSGPDPQDYWVDDVEVTTSSSTATITFPEAQPFGACCDGVACAITTESGCLNSGGTFMGTGTTCEPNPCGPTGSCCLADYTCFDNVTSEQCQDIDPTATWTDGGACAVDCVEPTGSCCLLDGSCVTGVTTSDCDAMRGRQWTEGAADCNPACQAAVLAPVIISEYYESAPGSRKAIEIFNASAQPVSLYGHALARYANAATTPCGSCVYLLDDITLGGFEVLVFINNAGTDIPNFDESTAIVAPSVCNFNGDDAVGILFGEISDNNAVDLFAVPGERDGGPRGRDPYKDAAWERDCGITSGTADFDSCNFDNLKDCAKPECPRGTPLTCTDGANAGEWVFEGRNPWNDNCHHSLGIHEVCVDMSLDIKPASCPNSFNPGSHGVLPMALLGTANVPAGMIDLNTVSLTRADFCAGEGEVYLTEIPLLLEDVATPLDAEACNCSELGGDGIADVVLHFDSDSVTSTLDLFNLDRGALVELVVNGQLIDGTAFSATDCIRLVPPGSSTRAVSVESNVPDAWVDVTPLDLGLHGSGYASFQRDYPATSIVTLTAQPAVGNAQFMGWMIDGVMRRPDAQQTGGTSIETLRFEIADAVTVKAVYVEPSVRPRPTIGPSSGAKTLSKSR